MDVLDAVVALLAPYAPWIALALGAVGLFSVLRAALSSNTTVGLLWLAVLFGILGAYLLLSGWILYGAIALGLAFLVILGDSLHERRVNRRSWGRMNG